MDPNKLKNATLSSAATYLASGIDPKKSIIFIQSDVKEHTELAWMLNCITPLGWLKRMTQFKDKAGKNQDNANTGLFTYPILMAADILLYNADVVPVGDDQKQHLELTRDIAGAVNRKFNQEILKIPEPLIQGTATRVMSLRGGTKKMSKSDESEASRINLTDSPETIIKKIKKSKTDSIAEIFYDQSERAEISNLINIYSGLTKTTKDEIVSQYSGLGFAKFKLDLTDIIIEKLAPINNEYQKVMKDISYIKNILDEGAGKARIAANKTYTRVAKAFGLL